MPGEYGVDHEDVAPFPGDAEHFGHGTAGIVVVQVVEKANTPHRIEARRWKRQANGRANHSHPTALPKDVHVLACDVDADGMCHTPFEK